MPPQISVYSRLGDCQAVKLLAIANLQGATAQLCPLKDAALIPDCPAISSSSVLALIDGGRVIFEPNAIVAALGSPNVQELANLEWERAVLQPAVLAANKPHASHVLTAALGQLADKLKSSGYLTGSKPAISDLSICATLLPVLHGAAPSVSVPDAVATWAASCQQNEAMAAAIQQVVGSSIDQLLACYASDAAAASMATELLPQPGQRNILVTSALPYVNNVPHLGNIIGCVLSADCYARYCRARGYNTVYICGTDEYGTATETKALEEGLSCADLCDKYHAIHAAVYTWFDIQFDKFGRTPSRAQTQICQDIFHTLEQQGCLQEQSMEQLYSEALGKFLADRFVIGTCPKCKYEDARGDQCDNCGALLNPTELINPKCKMTGTTPVIKSTRHLFLDLPKLTKPLEEYQNSTSAKGGWSSNCVQLTKAWMDTGLKPRCITRDLKWGTPVPRKGFEDKVFYVWFDAPIGYISITANYTAEWEKWWKNPDDVEMVQFMGKDNVPFHTVIFPASLIGTRQPWTLMKSISVTEYLNYEGGKFSKSRGTGVFGNDAKDTGIPVEVWRYYLLSVRPEQSDTDFKWSDLQARNNSELMANLGNFINRSLMFVVKFFDGKVPAIHPTKGAEAIAELGKAIYPKVQEYIETMEKIKLKDGIKIAMSVSADANKFIQDTKPWVVVREDPEHCGSIVATAIGVVKLLAALVSPFIPSLSRKVLAQLALPESCWSLTEDVVKACQNPGSLSPAAGHVIGTPAPLVSIISDEVIATLRDRYGGNQAERDAKAAAASGGSAGGKPATKGAAADAKSAKAPAGDKAKQDKAAGKAKQEKAAAQEPSKQKQKQPKPDQAAGKPASKPEDSGNQQAA